MKANREESDIGLASLADEAWRPAAELGLLMIEPVFWGVGARRGDGRPVLVLPGLYGGAATWARCAIGFAASATAPSLRVWIEIQDGQNGSSTTWVSSQKLSFGRAGSG